MALDQIRPEFVEAMPEDLEQGLLYISTRFRTAAHLCACGCDSKIVTPIRPAKWNFTYDGKSISLWPSVGNWQKPCRSHYVIKNSKINWARKWTEEEIAEGRDQDQADLRDYYSHISAEPHAAVESPSSKERGWIRRQLSKIAVLVRRG